MLSVRGERARSVQPLESLQFQEFLPRIDVVEEEQTDAPRYGEPSLAVLASPIRDQLRDLPVVMMQATEHWKCDDASGGLRACRPGWDALTDSLMGTSAVEERRVLATDSSELFLVDNWHVVEYLAP